MKVSGLRHQFVDEIPADLDHGVIYISMEFATTMHLCCCGCGSVVVLPLRPTAWTLSYDGESVSMSPSVGNWSFPCRSHYWIRNGGVSWAGEWSDQRIAVGRRRAERERGGLPIKTGLEPSGGRISRFVAKLLRR